MNIKIISLFFIVCLSMVYIYLQTQNKTTIKSIKQEDNHTILSKNTNIDNLTSQSQVTPDTNNLKHKKFNDIFKAPKENIVEEISENKDIQELDIKVNQIITNANSIIKQHNLTIKMKQIKENTPEVDSLISQLEEVSDAN